LAHHPTSYDRIFTWSPKSRNSQHAYASVGVIETAFTYSYQSRYNEFALTEHK